MKRNNDTVYKLITQDFYISLENYVISPKYILKSQILKFKTGYNLTWNRLWLFILLETKLIGLTEAYNKWKFFSIALI